MAKKYFYLEESPYMTGYSMIYAKLDEMPFPNGTTGSYGLLPARLLGLSFPEYARFARDVLGAQIIGKDQKWIQIYFRSTPEVQQFLKLLNARMEMIMYDRAHPYAILENADGTMKKEPFVNVSNS